jgi:predicted O-methyltransferase YrrM
MKFYGPILDGYDITENTNIGKELYKVARLDSVKMFLEVGTQVGGSARCIATGLSETVGHLHTIEAIKSRVEEAKSNLEGLPVTCHWSSTGSVGGLKRYYNRHSDQIEQENNLLSNLIEENGFDAVFLDSCIETQQNELELCVEKGIKHILMHEPDAKCPLYTSFMSGKGYKLIDSGRDVINQHNPLWVRFDNE